MGIPEKITELEEELSRTPYNKATQFHFAVVRARIAKLREGLELQQRKKTAAAKHGFGVRKSGHATVALLGFPSTGKSTLLNKLTGAKSKVARWAFTTLEVVPGVILHHGARIQILDVPGVVSGAARGKGRGKEVLSIVRNSDLVLILVDAQYPEQLPALLHELNDANVRPNASPPNIKIAKRHRGGISIASTTPMKRLTKDAIVGILRELKISNADVVLREDADEERFIDAVFGNRAYIPTIIVVSKSDLLTPEQKAVLKHEIKPALFVSAEKEQNVTELRDLLFSRLNLIRIYMKEYGKKPDMDEPLIIRAPATVRNVCQAIHRDFTRKFRYAKVWGKSVRHAGQIIRTLDKAVADGDIIEIRVK